MPVRASAGRLWRARWVGVVRVLVEVHCARNSVFSIRCSVFRCIATKRRKDRKKGNLTAETRRTLRGDWDFDCGGFQFLEAVFGGELFHDGEAEVGLDRSRVRDVAVGFVDADELGAGG